ncbi:MAG TPA: hypothetical protein P5555_02685 [Candidatus Paceibacterota bacterium]|nr:hypothetical protein [Verrucomicrobiota bacterium]HRZ44080.1 hypothetical protein [Candidatus Paceibacterota bacterium]
MAFKDRLLNTLPQKKEAVKGPPHPLQPQFKANPSSRVFAFFGAKVPGPIFLSRKKRTFVIRHSITAPPLYSIIYCGKRTRLGAARNLFRA